MPSNVLVVSGRYSQIDVHLDELDHQIRLYEALLNKNEGGVLSENDDILPFFKVDAPLLSCVIPLSNSWTATGPYLYRFELPLYGQMRPDLTVLYGGTVYFIEFEDAYPTSMFEGKKQEREFATRFNHGYSQIIDWFWRVETMSPTDKQAWFGHFQSLDIKGILVIGRNRYIQDSNEEARMFWRSRKIIIDSKSIEVVTYDDLLHSFKGFQAGILNIVAMRTSETK